MEIWVIGWLISAGVGAIIGSTKGRAAGGATMGLLAGPIGWLVVFLAPDVRPKCPECCGAIVPKARKCKNCGSPIPRCPSCGRQIGLKRRSECQHCGEPLNVVVVLLCPKCRRKFGVLHKALGTRVACSHCGEGIVTAAPVFPQETHRPIFKPAIQAVPANDKRFDARGRNCRKWAKLLALGAVLFTVYAIAIVCISTPNFKADQLVHEYRDEMKGRKVRVTGKILMTNSLADIHRIRMQLGEHLGPVDPLDESIYTKIWLYNGHFGSLERVCCMGTFLPGHQLFPNEEITIEGEITGIFHVDPPAVTVELKDCMTIK